MTSLFVLAFLAGVLTIATPCLLPVLPGVLGGALGTNKWRPCGVVVGMVSTFTFFGTGFAIFLNVLGVSPGAVRTISIAMLLVFGLALAAPVLYEWVFMKATFVWRIVRGAKNVRRPSDNGFWGAFGIGATLGAIWTPCAGPILGLILTIATTTHSILRSGILFFAYALGAGFPMLIIGYGGRAIVRHMKALARVSARIQQCAGVVMALWAIGMLFGVDRNIQAVVAPLFPLLPL